MLIQAVEAQERLYTAANPEWKDSNEKTVKHLKKLEKSIKDWNEATEDRAEGDFEDSIKSIQAQSDLMEKIFVANDILIGEEQEEEEILDEEE